MPFRRHIPKENHVRDEAQRGGYPLTQDVVRRPHGPTEEPMEWNLIGALIHGWIL